MRMLILTASFGTGHNQVAGALAEAAALQGHTADVVDALSVCTPMVNRIMTRTFLQVLRTAPAFYRFAYTRSEDPGRLDDTKASIVGLLTRLMRSRLADLLAAQQPDQVICTHPLMLGVMANLRRSGQVAVPVTGVLTDFAPHALWLHAGVDAYCVATREMRETMVAQGVAPERIHVTGIPVRPAFSAPPDRASAADRLGLDPTCPTLLLTGGGLGLGPIAAVAEAVVGLPGVQVLVVAGRNQRLYDELAPLARSCPRLHLYGYISQMETVMAASDLLVGKAGAVTAAEALAVGLPSLFVRPIPGNEERNQAVLVGAGAACAVPPSASIAGAVAGLLVEPERLAAMRVSALRAGAPHAAERVMALMTQGLESWVPLAESLVG